ncbi:hypothetical protein DSM106972_072600 [Dulcicalothrix desertica PCC 7102]|jgi:hypothetical protein|uniref:Uncharacterized protein n=1 Tax=Dulcicalothrix desertica PCC 7102 TaxID=232991 RepID=A0A3S1C619_9CYAN|nr:hypothetical protein [Dulcicalothrix desertica]RUT00851.1 hypothetical protein DSM106972_072600 [Dulcicalothrix desertica PCC 7102]TWH42311.1 hypothetical protein CAL7102_05952 [Dulcicalothrix desertica PCC 7102]
MLTVEFQAKVENGIILIPEEYKKELTNANFVKVTVNKQSEKKAKEVDIMDELAQNPIEVPGVRSISREQMHER